MRPELQKMLSHCGMAENSGLQTTLVCSNQQCSGPLYKGVRQSVSKKAGPPTETGLANKWLQGKKEERQLLAYATGRITDFFFPFANYLLSQGTTPSRALSLRPGVIQCSYSASLIALSTLPIPWLGYEPSESSTGDCLSCLSFLFNGFLRSYSKHSQNKLRSSSTDLSSLRHGGQIVFSSVSSRTNGNSGALNIFANF